MDLLKREWAEAWQWFFETASSETQIIVGLSILTGIGAVIYGGARFVAWLDSRKRDPLTVQLPQRLETHFEISLDEYEKRIATKITDAETKLKSAHAEEKQTLLTQITELKRRAANPESALAEARETIAKLESALSREGNEHDISDAKMTDAREALERGDFSIADEIFAEIEAREKLAVERTARAAYSRGIIAQQEVRWHDAAKHFVRASELAPISLNIHKAQLLLQSSGDYTSAAYWGEKLIPAVIRDEGKDSVPHATCLNNLAGLYRAQGLNEKAEPLFLQAIEITKKSLGEEHPDYAASLNNLAGLYDAQGLYEKAEPLYLQASEIIKKTLGEEHPDYAASLNNLAALYKAQGLYEKAEPLYLQAIKIDKKTIGVEHPDYAIRLNNLAALYKAQGLYEKAEPLFQQAIEIDKKTIGEEHPDYAIDLNNLAGLYRAQGLYEKAEPLYLQAIQIGKKTIGAEHPSYAIRLNNLAGLYVAQGLYEKAEPLFLQAIEIDKKTIGVEHPDYAIDLNNLAELYKAQGLYEKAEPFYLQAIEICKKTLGDDHPQTKAAIANYELMKSKI